MAQPHRVRTIVVDHTIATGEAEKARAIPLRQAQHQLTVNGNIATATLVTAILGVPAFIKRSPNATPV